MKVSLVDNLSCKLLDTILPVIAQSEDCKIAVAFVSVGGVALLESAFHQCLRRNGRLEFLVGLDLLGTDPHALMRLYRMSQEDRRVALYCFASDDITAVYHPKLYIATAGDEATIVIGSSNLTESGLTKNVEANAVIRAGLGEEIVSDAMALYNTLKFDPRRVEPDPEFLTLYEEICRAKGEKGRDSDRNAHMRTLTAQFRQKASSLRRPIPTEKDLFGWQKLVFTKLPDGPFRPRDLYPLEEEFRKYYPENQNIRPKIRQVLQQLRDLGMVRQIERGIWMKTL